MTLHAAWTAETAAIGVGGRVVSTAVFKTYSIPRDNRNDAVIAVLGGGGIGGASVFVLPLDAFERFFLNTSSAAAVFVAIRTSMASKGALVASNNHVAIPIVMFKFGST